MTDRDRLILDITKSDKKINEKCQNCTDPKGSSTYCAKCSCEQLADNLIADGWIRPPCKVGDIVYTIFDGEIETLNVNRAKTEESMESTYRSYDAGNKFLKTPFTEHHIGKTVFLTKEEAEAKLKELQNG